MAWLAQQMAKTPIARLLRTVGEPSGRSSPGVVADRLGQRRLDGLVQIDVGEISHRRGQRYLTTVVDHDSGAIVWCSPGRNAQTLQGVFDLLYGRKHSVCSVSIDMSGGYQQGDQRLDPALRHLL